MALVYRNQLTRPLTVEEADGNILQLYNLANNITVTRYVVVSADVTPDTIVDTVNAGAQFTVSETQSLWLIVQHGELVVGQTPVVSKYKVKGKGRGTYGLEGTQTLVRANLEFIGTYNATIDDLENDPNTVTYDLGTIVFSNFITLANEETHDFSNADFVYYFIYTIDGVEYSRRFIGTPGVYGFGNTPFVEADFTDGPTAVLPAPVPNAQQVMDQGNESTTPFVVIDEANDSKVQNNGTGVIFQKNELNITEKFADPVASVEYTKPAKPADDTYAMLSDIKQALPADNGFFISATQTEAADPHFGRYSTYITDEVRTIDLLPLMPEGYVFYRTMGIIRDGNNIYYKTKRDAITGNFGLLFLKNTGTANNVLVYDGSQYQEFPEVLKDASLVPYNLHSEAIIGDYIYLVTRTEEAGATQATQIIKINKYDISQYQVYDLPYSGDYIGSVGEAHVYGNYLYMLSRISSAGGANMLRIDAELTTPEFLFHCGNGTDFVINGSSPFVIDRDLIYIPSRYNLAAPTDASNNNLGLMVYSIATNQLVASNPLIEISTGFTSGAVVTHWMRMFNGKLFLHTCTTSSSTARKRVVRINPQTLLLDGPIDSGTNVASVNIGYNLTNNNTITPDGWFYGNPEGLFDKPLKRYKCSDLSVQETIIATGYYSTGSPEYPAVPVKEKLNLSDFNNDIIKPYAAFEDFPATGVVGNLYIDLEEQVIYNWTGSAYELIGADANSEIKHIDVTKQTITGEIAFNIVASYAFTPTTKGILKLRSHLRRPSTGAANAVIRYWLNTSNTVTGATQLAGLSMLTTVLFTPFERVFSLNDTDGLVGLASANGTSAVDAASTNASTATPLTIGNQYYIIVTVTLGNVADSVIYDSFKFEFEPTI